MRIDPSKTWRKVEARLAREKDPRLRRNLETLLAHMKAEAAPDLDALMATVAENASYNAFGAPDPLYSPQGKEAVRGFYTAFIASGAHRLELDVDRLVVDEDCIVTEGIMRIAYPGAIVQLLGHAVDDPDAYYLFETRMAVLWPMDEHGLVIGEDTYTGGDGFAGIAERKLSRPRPRVKTTDLTFPSSTGAPMRAALALPDRPEPRPAVIVIHEIFGLNDDIRRIAGRVADLGYVALAVDLYDTGGPRALCILRTLAGLVGGGGGRAIDDLEAARAWLGARPEVDATRTGVVGFCMGGGFALLYATRAPLNVAGAFYGDVPKAADGLRGICPVLGGFGARDRIFGPQGERLERLLTELGVAHDVVVYPDAGHSYMSRHPPGIMTTLGAWGPMAAGFDAHAEADSWRRIEAFYRAHLG